MDDLSGSFSKLRGGLTDSQGRSYAGFVRGLQPRWATVWRDVGLGYAALAGVVVLLTLLDGRHPALDVVLAIAGALLVGYAFAFVQLFLHEAAHYNIAPSRPLNDRLANWLIAAPIGQDIARYRQIHFDHHRFLGTTRDSENTYFRPLSPGFVVQTLTGWHAVRTYLGRDRRLAQAKPGKARAAAGGRVTPWLYAGLLAHLVLLGGLLAAGEYVAVAAWLAGIGAVFPFFGALRQLLEHRRPDADATVDYAARDHGAYSRMFGDGPVGRTLGGAGFNRHLLHHWEPQVSYTRLADLEAFLLDTAAAPIIEARRSSYPGTAAALWNGGRAAAGWRGRTAGP